MACTVMQRTCKIFYQTQVREMQTFVVTRLYCEDLAGTVSSVTEAGPVFRSQFVAEYAVCTMCGPIQSGIGIFMEKKILPPNVIAYKSN